MKNHRYLLGILCLGLLLRAGYLCQSARHNPTFEIPIVDSFTYDRLGAQWANGEGMGPESVWQPLFYPYFLGAVYRLCGRDLFLIRAIQSLLGLGTCLLTFRLGERCFSRKVGLLGAALAAVSGPLIFYEGELLPAVWAAFWFTGSLLIFQSLDPGGEGRRLKPAATTGNGGRRLKPAATAGDGGRGWRFAVLGAVCAVGIAIRPTIIPFYLAGFGFLLFLYRREEGWKSVGSLAATGIIGAAAVLLPTLWRNHRLTDHWILLPSSGGLNFYIGNNPEPEKTLVVRPGESWRLLTVAPREAGIFHAPYGGRYFYDLSWKYIQEQPGDFLRGLLHKTRLFINSREIPRNLDIYLFRRYSRLLGVLLWQKGGFSFPLGLILPLGLLGMALHLKRIRELWFLYGFLLLFPAAIILYFVTSRYRLPAIPSLGIFAAAAVGWIYQRLRRGAFLPAAAALAAGAILLVFCNRQTAIPEDAINFDSELHLSLATVLLTREEVGSAEEYLRQAVAADPANADAYYHRGTIHLRRGVTSAAEKNFQAALSFNPQHLRSYLQLGAIYLGENQLARARESFLSALALDPGDAEGRRRLAETYQRSGDGPAAIREYWAALKIQPDNIEARVALSRLLGSGGNWETGRELVAEAVRHHPENPQLRHELGLILGNSGQTAAAVEQLEIALRLHPDFALARLNLGIIYVRMGETGKAEEQRRLLTELDPELAERLRSLLLEIPQKSTSPTPEG